MKRVIPAVLLLLAPALLPSGVSAQAFEELLRSYGGPGVSAPELPAVPGIEGCGVVEASAFRLAFAAFGVCCVGAYAWFLLHGRAGADNPH